ncbi:MAG: dihydrolipoamide acetyltransferase family protein [Haloferacaceae archaeon]
MIREFRLPDVGEGVAEGELVQWLVEPGDPVSEDQPVAEVETDKALVKVPSPYDGTVHELHAAEGEVVPVGEVIIAFDVPEDGEAGGTEGGGAAAETEPTDDGEAGATEGGEATAGSGEATGTATDDGAATGGPSVAPPSVRRLARELGVDVDGVAGSGPGGRVTEGDVRAAAESDGEEEAADAPEPRSVSPGEGRSVVRRHDDGSEGTDGTGSGGATAAGSVDCADRDRTLAAPATRRIAEETGVDIDAVPTDETRDGEAYVTAEQVRAFAEAKAEARAEAEAEVGAEAATDPTAGEAAADPTAGSAGADPDGAGAEPTTGAEEPSGERVPYRGVRRSIGEHLERSRFTAPHATHYDVADATELVAVREELNAVADVRLTYLPFVLKAVVAGLREHPYVNAQLDAEREEIVLRDEYNVGVATATDAGLMVPVVEDVDAKGLTDIAREVRDLAERARDRTIASGEMRGGTFTVTNVGAIGGEYATPIVNHPEVAILALGTVEDRPRVVDGEVVARKTLPLSLSVDHRVVDGAVAARFTNHVIDLLEHPSRLLLE